MEDYSLGEKMSWLHNLEWILGVMSWRERHWDAKRYCERYGHPIKESEFSGLHIGKQIMMNRYIKYCDHCSKIFVKRDTPSEKEPGKYGVSFGSEGVCSNCSKKDCNSRPSSFQTSDGIWCHPTYVYVWCPINQFEGSDSFYERIKDNDNIMTR